MLRRQQCSAGRARQTILNHTPYLLVSVFPGLYMHADQQICIWPFRTAQLVEGYLAIHHARYANGSKFARKLAPVQCAMSTSKRSWHSLSNLTECSTGQACKIDIMCVVHTKVSLDQCCPCSVPLQHTSSGDQYHTLRLLQHCVDTPQRSTWGPSQGSLCKGQ